MKSVSYAIHKRVAPISQSIDAFLKQSGLPAKTFCHDMTFGNGMGAMLHSHDELVTRYYSAQDIPFVFTNEKFFTRSCEFRLRCVRKERTRKEVQGISHIFLIR